MDDSFGLAACVCKSASSDVWNVKCRGEKFIFAISLRNCFVMEFIYRNVGVPSTVKG